MVQPQRELDLLSASRARVSPAMFCFELADLVLIGPVPIKPDKTRVIQMPRMMQ
jgi:hypothetical protein